MRWLIYSLITLGVLVLTLMVAPTVIGDRGYVLITLGDTAIEMTVISLVISVVVLAIVWWAVKHLFFWLLSLFKGSHQWFGVLGEKKRNRAFYGGLQALAEGNGKRALTLLSKTHQGDYDGVNYLASAQAALNQGDPSHARRLLVEAQEYDNALVAAAVMQSTIDLEDNNFSEALARLNELPEKASTHPTVVKMKARLMAELGQWGSLEAQLGQWKKQLDKSDFARWSTRIAKGKFSEIASKQGANQLKAYWHSLPKKLRNDMAYRVAFTEQLLEQGMHSDAQTHLVEWQKSQYEPQLLPLYRRLNLPNASPSIERLEKWIKSDPDNAVLYSTLGHVAFNANDVFLAEKALMKAVALSPTQDDLLLLARLSEKKHEPQQALQFVRQSIALNSNR